jgi:hypothetical protein
VNACGNIFERVNFESQAHATFSAYQIGDGGDARAFRAFEEECRAARFYGAVGDFRDFEDGVDFDGDAAKFVIFFHLTQEISQVSIRHCPSLVSLLRVRRSHFNTEACDDEASLLEPRKATEGKKI